MKKSIEFGKVIGVVLMALFLLVPVGYLRMLTYNPPVATPEDVALMVNETKYTVAVLALVFIAAVLVAIKYNKLAITVAFPTFIFSVGYSIFMYTERYTLAVYVWIYAAIAVYVIIAALPGAFSVKVKLPINCRIIGTNEGKKAGGKGNFF